MVNKDQLYYDKELDLHIFDLNILLGQSGAQGGPPPRDPKDIIVVTSTVCRALVHQTNVVPVKEYLGNKRDI